jgi:hypothetical protein
MAKEDDDVIKDLRQTLQSMRKAAKDFEDTMEGVDKETRQGRKEELKDLEEKLELLKKSTTASKQQIADAEETLKLIKKQNQTLQEQYQVTGRIFQEFAKTGEEYKNFLQTTAAQYNLAQSIAKEYKTLGKEIGLGASSSELLARSFKDALPDVLEMGMEASDLSQMYKQIAETSGRITPVNADDAEKIMAIAAGTNMMASDAGDMAEAFSLMGMTVDAMEENLMETFKSSQAMGLNATKVIKTLQTNLRTMQGYSFANGVKGMTEMSKLAVKMRMDVSDMLNMADKFYEPEAAIEAAANLQMLGGDIAEAFGDPFETMYLARNKPEELAKKVGEMTENMMQFNEETGEYEFPAEVRMQLKAAGEQLGINTEKMIEMSRQSSKIKDIRMKFTSIGDDDVKDNLASLATFSKERGEFVIQHKGEELGLDEISDGMAEEIMKANQSDSDTFKDIAVNTQTMSDNLKNFQEANKARAVGTIDLYETTAAQMQEPLNDIKNGITQTTEAWVARGKEFVDDMFKNSQGSSILSETTQELGEFGRLLKDKTIKSFEDLNEQLDIFSQGLPNTPNNNTNPGDDPETRCTRAGGKYDTSTGKCMNNNVEIPFAKGGIVTKPTRALIGEAGEAEGVFPLSKLENFIGSQKMNGSIKLEGTSNININISSDNPSLDLSSIQTSLKSKIENMIVSHLNGTFRNGGVPSSKETTDYMA